MGAARYTMGAVFRLLSIRSYQSRIAYVPANVNIQPPDYEKPTTSLNKPGSRLGPRLRFADLTVDRHVQRRCTAAVPAGPTPLRPICGWTLTAPSPSRPRWRVLCMHVCGCVHQRAGGLGHRGPTAHGAHCVQGVLAFHGPANVPGRPSRRRPDRPAANRREPHEPGACRACRVGLARECWELGCG